MTARGFIQDKLEIKFLILYLAARVIEPVPFDTLLDLTLCDDAVDYFDFSECLADLVKTEHLTLDEESGLWERGEELHEERAYTPEELTSYLRDAGFTQIKQYGNLKHRPPKPGEDRIFFTARKEV